MVYVNTDVYQPAMTRDRLIKECDKWYELIRMQISYISIELYLKEISIHTTGSSTGGSSPAFEQFQVASSSSTEELSFLECSSRSGSDQSISPDTITDTQVRPNVDDARYV